MAPIVERAISPMHPLTIVWFKRDLRTADHLPLAEAASRGRVLPLYVAEPELWRQPDASGRQWSFVAESLAELRAELARLGQPLVLRVGAVERVLGAIADRLGRFELASHEETGNLWTYARDRRVAAWCRARGIVWRETPSHGVIRRLVTRDGWAAKWEARMTEPMAAVPAAIAPLRELDPGPIPSAADLGIPADPCPGRQAGGRRAGRDLLDSFLHRRGGAYHWAVSSPLTAAVGCSRLSPHLAWGTLSPREVLQETRRRRAVLPPAEAAWQRALSAFEARLHWHCHFIQKLESEPEIEIRNLHPAYDDLRTEADSAHLAAWCDGQTGLPFVDACMRALAATGWINFRARAMLCAVASYHLWLPWRQPALHLARRFTDYEPGIHYSQIQMQSGTTGINTVRIYNPVKQGQDHDPHGSFVRRWCPELRAVPGAAVHAPWAIDPAELRRHGIRLGATYPLPIVDHLGAARAARDAVWAVRRGPHFATGAEAIQEKHGSRKAGLPDAGRRRPRQSSLPL